MNAITNEDRLRLVELRREQFRREARKGLFRFTQFTKPDYKPQWYHKLLCQYLDRFVRGEIRRLMVFMPPRHGKSEHVSRRLPAYIFGQNPDAQIIATSYSADLASMMNRDTQRIMDTSAYQELFPSTRLEGKNVRSVADGTALRNSDIFEIVGHRGIYRCAGVGGGITGMGGDYLIIDDPIKNRKEADSLTYRNALWEWYTSTLSTRLEGEGHILLTVTRWHEDALEARLLKLAQADQNADQWTVLSLPALCEDATRHPLDAREEGEALWPGKFPKRRLLAMKATNARDFASLYQQRPTAAEGGIIKRAWLTKFWKQLPANPSKMIHSWDMAFKGKSSSDYVVGSIWWRVGGEFYLVDLVRDKMDFPTTKVAFKAFCAKHPRARMKVVEDKANGPAVMSDLQKDIPGIVPFNTANYKQANDSKAGRASAVAPYFQAGNVWLPDPSIAPWVNDYIEELVNFTGADGGVDDQVDVTSQALIVLTEAEDILKKMTSY